MYSSTCSIDVVFDSTALISNSSHESKDWIKLHSSSELDVFSAISFTCCDLHIFAKLFGLEQGLHILPIAGHFFRWRSPNGRPHRIQGFVPSIFSVISSSLVLFPRLSPTVCAFVPHVHNLFLFYLHSPMNLTCTSSSCVWFLKCLRRLFTLFKLQWPFQHLIRRKCFERLCNLQCRIVHFRYEQVAN